MRVFVTGATGFIGMAVTKELIAAGHQVLGLSRTEAKAAALAATGAGVVLGSIGDLDALTKTAAAADGVIHLAFNHDDFSRLPESCEKDRRIIAALGEGLRAGAPLLVTSGTAIAGTIPGEPSKEDNPTFGSDVNPRAASEEAAAAVAAKGGNVSVVRLPQVHDPVRQGLISPAIDIYRAKGACFYVGEGSNRWPAAHYRDVARLYRLALERAEPNAKYHAVAEEGVAMRAIAETIGRRLNLPVKSVTAEEAPAQLGWLAWFAAQDMPASSAQTRKTLGWLPTGPGLLADLEQLQIANG